MPEESITLLSVVQREQIPPPRAPQPQCPHSLTLPARCCGAYRTSCWGSSHTCIHETSCLAHCTTIKAASLLHITKKPCTCLYVCYTHLWEGLRHCQDPTTAKVQKYEGGQAFSQSHNQAVEAHAIKICCSLCYVVLWSAGVMPA